MDLNFYSHTKFRAKDGTVFFPTTLKVGSVSSRECLDAPAIFATFTAGRTGLVACLRRHYNFNNYADNPHVDCINFIGFFFCIVLRKSEMRKVFPETPPKSVKFQKKDEIPLNYAVSLIGQSKQ